MTVKGYDKKNSIPILSWGQGGGIKYKSPYKEIKTFSHSKIKNEAIV